MTTLKMAVLAGGMVLGVFTFIVLLRPSVKELFARAAGRVGLDPPYAEPAD